MPQKLPVIRIVILREGRQLPGLSDVMKQGRCQQQIPVQTRIDGSKIVAQLHHAQRMLQKPSHKAVVHALGCGVEAEAAHKILVLYEVAARQLSQERILHRIDQPSQFPVHGLNVLGADGKVVTLHIFSCVCLSDPAYIDLVGALEYGHISIYIHIVQHLEAADSRRAQIPDLGVHGSGLILKGKGPVFLAVLRQCNLLFLTKIHV